MRVLVELVRAPAPVADSQGAHVGSHYRPGCRTDRARNQLAKNLGFKSLKELHESAVDPEVSMKLLMAHYRRMSVLVEYEQKGKARLQGT